MRLFFWQNCLSPHQLPYIAKLLDDKRVDDVVVVAGETINAKRTKMGWMLGDYPGLDRCKVYVIPHDKIIDSLLQERMADSVHLFSGIHGFAFVFKCLKMSLAYPLRRCLITELPNTYAYGVANGKPLWLHSLRFVLQDRKYAKHIDTVFAMGSKAAEYFRGINKKWNVFPFMYCTQPMRRLRSIGQTGSARFIFVGSLSYWKAPMALSKALAHCVKTKKDIGGVTFVGDGDEKRKIEDYIRKRRIENYVCFSGFSPQTELPLWLAKNDVLILPSIYDGWGAVVNEALQMGLYVICSDACGAADLIRKDKRLGIVFNKGDVERLASAMSYCMDNIENIRKDHDYRLRWADKHISGKVIAKYMIDCLCKL